jgi:pectinesterase
MKTRMLSTLCLILSIVCGCNNDSQITASIRRIIVAADGSGQFTSVQAAVDSIEHGNTTPVVIDIRSGTYKERVKVPSGKNFIRFEGKDAETTILTYDLHANISGDDGKPIGTFRTPSTTIEADDFSATNITFANTAGPQGQALAISVLGDRAVFRNCRFIGWQDTLFTQAGRHYYKDCYIEGRTDFIFGGGTDYFDRCHIFCFGKSYLTAASTPKDQQWGYVFKDCKITSKNIKDKTYLGRPWRDYAAVMFINTWMDEGVRPEGWHNWSKPNRETTSRYYEYGSTGPGANPQTRVLWAHTLTKDQAAAVTVSKVLGGADGWNPNAR